MTLKDPFAALPPVETAHTRAVTPADSQRAAETAGTLRATVVHGPNRTLIPAYYDAVENAFVPAFEEDPA